MIVITYFCESNPKMSKKTNKKIECTMNKITVIGAGNVGATCANVIAHKDWLAKLF